jgi:hypothetical protein
MVVSHRESSISSNIRAIIEQLNLNPVERRRLIESRPDDIHGLKQQLSEAPRPRVTIGVYGIRQTTGEQQPRPRKVARRAEPRPRQRLPPRISPEQPTLPQEEAGLPPLEDEPTVISPPGSRFYRHWTPRPSPAPVLHSVFSGPSFSADPLAL